MSVVHSILLYGAEVWAEALDIEIHRKNPGQFNDAARLGSHVRIDVEGGDVGDCGPSG